MCDVAPHLMYLGAECAYCAGGLMAPSSAGEPAPLAAGSGSSMCCGDDCELAAGDHTTWTLSQEYNYVYVTVLFASPPFGFRHEFGGKAMGGGGSGLSLSLPEYIPKVKLCKGLSITSRVYSKVKLCKGLSPSPETPLLLTSRVYS